jgi:hypothetical protein
MKETRLTYVPLYIAEHFDDFIITRDEQSLDAVKARAHDYSTLSLLKLLYQLSSGPMTFSDLYTSSKIRMKRSFLNYLHLCVEYNFIARKKLGQCMIYSITEKGRIMLNLFMHKGN